jgi:hypothetical protein
VNVAIHPAPGVQPCFKCPVREEPELLGLNPLQPLVRPFPGALESLVLRSAYRVRKESSGRNTGISAERWKRL